MGGPTAVPGDYRARLTVRDAGVEVPFQVLADPRSSAGTADLQAQHDFVAGVCDTLTRVHRAIEELRALRSDLRELTGKLPEEDADLRPRIDAA